MKPRSVIQGVVSVAILVFAAGIWSGGSKPSSAWLDYYSYAATAALAAYWLWETLFWRLPVVQRMGIAPRNLRGTWQGTLAPVAANGTSSILHGSKDVYLVIRQSASTVRAFLLTDEAQSVSTLASVNSEAGVASLDYVYSNSPDLRHRHRSPIHNGSCSLKITGVPATRLKGSYWTDRNSCGELEFTKRVSSSAEDFNEAKAMFANETKR
ncbi:MAG: hypothetical protein CVT69_01330 [Actinobacteria bacterium HGW-Actinobacteria-9]|jgi:hypothetical protein|nr:MAG: hypothetical protein CVT69_01330 [Actinobacteria bacterium HGW-Actinobacteria-9]